MRGARWGGTPTVGMRTGAGLPAKSPARAGHFPPSAGCLPALPLPFVLSFASALAFRLLRSNSRSSAPPKGADTAGGSASAATAPAAAATPRGRRSARGGRRSRCRPADGDRGQQLHGVRVPVRAARRRARLGHGAGQFESRRTFPAAVFVSRHGGSVTGSAARRGECGGGQNGTTGTATTPPRRSGAGAPPAAQRPAARSSRIRSTTCCTVSRTASSSVSRCQ